MATWRGTINEIAPIVGRWRILGYKVLVRFEVLNPAPVHRIDEAWDYDLNWIRGKTPQQIRQMVLNVGGPVKALDPPAPAGTFTKPYPPPLLERGDAVLSEWLEAEAARELLDLVTFPLAIAVP